MLKSYLKTIVLAGMVFLTLLGTTYKSTAMLLEEDAEEWDYHKINKKYNAHLALHPPVEFTEEELDLEYEIQHNSTVKIRQGETWVRTWHYHDGKQTKEVVTLMNRCFMCNE